MADVAILLLGARRLDSLAEGPRATFLGRHRVYLDPLWVAQLRAEFAHRSMRDLGRRLVDDMLAQSRRVALRKVRVSRDGTILLFTRLHERNGSYFASSPEGRGDVGLRIPQVADIATQLGLLSADPREPVTAQGQALLAVAG